MLVAVVGIAAGAGCVSPGQCTPPAAKYSRVIAGPIPGQQWNINGGFCGAFSAQHAALAFGAWISQDLVRKANKDTTPEPRFMHGNATLGYEVVPSNVAATAKGLKLEYDEWDYTSPAPQADAFKRWIKAHLVKGSPVVWFPMCKGDPPLCYPFACPNGGIMSHVEPMYGIFSNHSLDEADVFEDDWILHASDQVPHRGGGGGGREATRLSGRVERQVATWRHAGRSQLRDEARRRGPGARGAARDCGARRGGERGRGGPAGRAQVRTSVRHAAKAESDACRQLVGQCSEVARSGVAVPARRGERGRRELGGIDRGIRDRGGEADEEAGAADERGARPRREVWQRARTDAHRSGQPCRSADA